jgi:hypothetical protein
MHSYFNNSKQLLSLFFVGIIFFTSCQKVLPPIFKHGGSGNAQVFVAGYESNGSVNVAKCWIDGKEITLSDGTNEAKANSVYVSNNDVYIAGSDNGAVYWKNNKEIRLSGDGASSIVVSGNDIYVAGSNNPRAVYWKNGTEVLLENTNVYGNSGYSFANSVIVSGNDVYAAGYDGPNAVYWKNGVEVYLTQGTSPTLTQVVHATSIFVSGNDIYVVGFFNSAGTPFPQLKYWKNGDDISINRPPDTFGPANSVFVSGSDVYIAGTLESPPKYNYTAVFWKNGNITLLPVSEINSFANSIYVSGNKVYVAGYEEATYPVSYAVYWKDGVEVKLTDGTQAAIATSIFVK